MDDIKKEIEFKGLVMSNVSEKVRTLFKQLAKEEFDNHYGFTLRELLFSYFEYQQLKSMFLQGELPIRIGLEDKNVNSPEKVIKSISGKPIKFQKEEI